MFLFKVSFVCFLLSFSLCQPDLGSTGSGEPLRLCVGQGVSSLGLFLFLSNLEVRTDSTPDLRG